MGTLQKLTAKPLTFQRKPEEFTLKLLAYLKTVQGVYRVDLAESELELWVGTLSEDCSFEEIDAAFRQLVRNPPRQQLDNGTVQVWRGMPKLPDVLQTIWDLREVRVNERKQLEADRRARELRELEQRRKEHPEEFITSFADILKEASDKIPRTSAPEIRKPIVIGEDDPIRELQVQKQREYLKQQAAFLKAKYGV